MSGLRQFFEDDCSEFKQWLAAGEQADDILYVRFDGEHSCHLAVLGGPPIQLKKQCVLLGVKIASAVEEREIVGEQLVRLGNQCLKSGIDFCLQTHLIIIHPPPIPINYPVSQ